MLTGRWAFEDELAARSGTDAVQDRNPQLGRRSPAPPSKYNSRVPRELDRLVLKCLSRDPARRHQSVRDLVRDLARFPEGEDKMWPDSAEIRRNLV